MKESLLSLKEETTTQHELSYFRITSKY